jgi:hypothetical protein
MHKLTSRLAKAKTNPELAWALLKGSFWKPFRAALYVGSPTNRSISDNGLYAAFCEQAASSAKAFGSFRRHPHYVPILEHVTKEKGAEYLDAIKSLSPGMLSEIEAFKINDTVGNPIVHEYPTAGRIGPTTLRYIKVAADLQRYFGGHSIRRIAEVGVGYGGQLLVTDRIMAFDKWHLFDLPPVLKLASRYLESHILNGAYELHTLNQVDGGEKYDLVVSNYAFSELPSALQEAYVRKVLANASRGYLTMNSGRQGCAFQGNHLSLERLRELLPSFEVVDEVPLTAQSNYVVIWGHRNPGIVPEV